MSDSEEASTPPPFHRLRLSELQDFLLGPNTRERVLQLLQRTAAGDLLQQTAAAADALALQRGAQTEADRRMAKAAVRRAAAAGDREAAEKLQLLLESLLHTIHRCFDVEDLRDNILSQPEMRPLLTAAATSPWTAIRALLGQQLLNISKKGLSGAEFIWRLELQRQLLLLLQDRETEVAMKAEGALEELCMLEEAPRFVLSGPFFFELKKILMADPAPIAFRILSPLIHGAVHRASFLDSLRAEAPEALRRLQQFLMDREDYLLQANASELLCNLVSCPWGMTFALDMQYPERVVAMLDDDLEASEEGSFSVLLNLLCTMAVERPAECGRLMDLNEGQLTKRLQGYLDSSTDSSKEEGLLCWGTLCSKPESAAAVIERLPTSADIAAEAVMDVEAVSLAALHAWCCVLKDLKDVSEVPDPIRQVMETKMFNKLLECILQRPFPHVRARAYRLLQALALVSSSLQTFFSSADFRRLMIDPDADTTHEARIAKHDFARAAWRSEGPWLREAIDPSFSQQFYIFAEGNPFSFAGTHRTPATAT